ncbi:MAG: hypothetical protein ACT4PU_02145 [Planctomycetota bacterium]
MTPRDHTPYQQGIIKRFYEHRDTLALQRLGEIVSDLYLAESEAKLARGWKAVEKQLIAAGAPKHLSTTIVAERDLGALAKLIAELG